MSHPWVHHIWVSESRTPARWLFVLHGILGSGPNFRGLMQKLVAEAPGWAAALVDLRLHGRSQHVPPPHTLQAAAQDLVELAAELPGEPSAIMGHSFGGKVAATYASLLPPGRLQRLWVLDSPLGARPGRSESESTYEVLDILEGAPEEFDSRRAFVDYLRARGLSSSIGQWLAMNLERTGEQLRFKLDLAAIRTLLDDYYRTDLWPWLERTSTPTTLIRGERSQVWSEAQQRKAEAMAREHDHVTLRVVPDAGHWLHVDNPEGTLRAILQDLPR